MSVFSDSNYEVIHRILEMLPTIAEALDHMQTQLDELRLEESAVLFRDAVEAIGSIAYSTQSIIDIGNNQKLLNALTDVRQGIAGVNDGYEQNILDAIQRALILRLIPSFSNWQRELVRILMPSILM